MNKNLNIWNDGEEFHTVEVPRALRCAICTGTLFQAFRDDKWVVTRKDCSHCKGKGLAPIPPAEVGL